MVREKEEKKITPVFNPNGELKGTLSEQKDGGLSFVTLNFNDEEGKKLILDRVEEMMEKNYERWMKLTPPERLAAMGYTFDTLSTEHYSLVRQLTEARRRLRLIGRWADSGRSGFCQCSAMSLWEDDGNVVPYLYCLIEEGASRVSGEGVSEDNKCVRCKEAPCDHFYDPEFDCWICGDFSPRKSKYRISPCVYVNPSDEDIDMALEFRRGEQEGCKENG
jgi:hypothetical protein